MKKRARYKRWMYIPIIGIIVFVIFFGMAAICYPGGSAVNRTYEGFDWINNYWCDLLARTAQNGELNAARKIAITGMIILFSSLSVFWYHLPGFFHEGKRNTLIIRYTGIVAMFVLVFVFTRYHDNIISIGSTIVSIPVGATLTELNRHKLKGLYYFGLICILLILLNFFIYVTSWMIYILPLLQKITLLWFLIWILLTDLQFLRMSRVALLPSRGKMTNIIP